MPSTGTFPRKKDADRAWQAAEAKVADGRAADQSCTYVINKHVLPEFR
ncbi:MAG TPA: hypothetical protein VN961_01115 [Streptosporangiaceae bacterium]|nr:hypothetical protein [Streptosporangiaceae bacterium]